MYDAALSEEEIIRLTHYRRAAEQLRELERLGIPAKRRHDNTVCVLRMHTVHPSSPQASANQSPKLKSSRK
jgi:hypothetical protein